MLARSLAPVAVVALMFASAAHAQAPLNLRGKIVALTGDALAITTRDGVAATVKLAPGWGVSSLKKVTAAEIKPGSFIGTTEEDHADGRGRSLEVHIFPPGVKLGEGHYAWDLKPGSNMTNGTVGKVDAVDGGRQLEISYPTGQRKVVVPPDVPIVAIAPGDKTMLVPGALVFIRAVKTPDGSYASNHVTVGDKVSPPPM